ncbi:MAG TPA: alcohol dehydrogenase catalytic domain-containing protein [Candidatus Sulfotelmatobacter sp.]|nr:alcohol dehydrogenase catalytic domain-containing protein [Candidatus Sulfotelmatobacter sp.]
MRGTVLYGPRDIRFEDRETPRIEKPTDAVIRIAATCVCGSDLWPYRGIQKIAGPTPMGHEYCGVVEEVGSSVKTVKPGQFVIGSFFASDNACPHCQAGYQTSCQRREFVSTAQASTLRVPLADGTLVATPDIPSEDLVPGLLAASDVFGTGWFAAVAANVRPGATAVVVGDGAVGLLGVLAARHMGAERIIAMSRHESRQKLAREFGATEIVTERSDEGVERIKELTGGIGADSVLECVGTQESMRRRSAPRAQAGRSVTSAYLTAWNSTVRSCSTPMSAFTAARRRCAASFPNSSTWSGTKELTPAGYSTLFCLSIRSPKATVPWTNVAPSKRCSARSAKRESRFREDWDEHLVERGPPKNRRSR